MTMFIRILEPKTFVSIVDADVVISIHKESGPGICGFQCIDYVLRVLVWATIKCEGYSVWYGTFFDYC